MKGRLRRDGEDYILPMGATVWIEVGPWSIWIKAPSEIFSDLNGPTVEVFVNGQELNEPLARMIMPGRYVTK